MIIKYTKNAKNAIKKLSSSDKQRIRNAILGLTEKPPKGDIKKLEGQKNNRKRIRVGKYRIIFRYDEEGDIEILLIIDVGPRGDIYK